MRRYITTLLLSVVAFAIGCSDSGGNGEEPKPENGNKPIIELRTDEIVIDSEPQQVNIEYAITNPKSDGEITLRCSADWVGEPSYEEGRVVVAVERNSSGERSTVIRLLYPDADIVTLDLTQLAYGTTPDPNPDPTPDPNPDPNPDPTPDPSGSVYRTGWAELPIQTDNSDYYYASHMTDLKMGGNTARNYTVCFSSSHHCPVWVAAPRHSAYEGSTNRTDAYQADPKIPANIQYYSKSTGGGCNKGHMLGSAERTASSTTNKQVFYYTNIAPQYSSTFNTGGGAWNILEDHIDGLVCRDTTYVVIGTYFEKYTDKYGNTAYPKRIEFGGRSDVSCPTMFYYAVLRTKSGNSGKSVLNCSSSELKCVAFVRCHECKKGTEVQSKDLMSIEELERLTGHTFFPNVKNAPKSTYTASEWL